MKGQDGRLRQACFATCNLRLSNLANCRWMFPGVYDKKIRIGIWGDRLIVFHDHGLFYGFLNGESPIGGYCSDSLKAGSFHKVLDRLPEVHRVRGVDANGVSATVPLTLSVIQSPNLDLLSFLLLQPMGDKRCQSYTNAWQLLQPCLASGFEYFIDALW